MTIRIAKRKAAGDLLAAVEEKAGVNLRACYQCKKCSIGCPVADLSTVSARGNYPTVAIGRRRRVIADRPDLDMSLL